MEKVISGKALADKIKEDLKVKAKGFHKNHGRPCGLAVVLVGNDCASEIYVNNKVKACETVGIKSMVYHIESTIDQDELCAVIDRLNDDVAVDGILVQLPLPSHINEKKIIEMITPDKDVDGFGKLTHHKPCTALACLELVKSVCPDITGKHAVVVGRSHIVGRPTAKLLLEHDCTVTVTHLKTVNLGLHTKMADILVVAAGHKHLITRDMVKPGAIVIDVGINRIDGKLYGDVDFDNVMDIVSHITPVPGGVGPMTIAMLLANTLGFNSLEFEGIRKVKLLKGGK